MTSVYLIPEEDTQFIKDQLSMSGNKWSYLVVIHQRMQGAKFPGVPMELTRRFLRQDFEERIRGDIVACLETSRMCDTFDAADEWGSRQTSKFDYEQPWFIGDFTHSIYAVPKHETTKERDIW